MWPNFGLFENCCVALEHSPMVEQKYLSYNVIINGHRQSRKYLPFVYHRYNLIKPFNQIAHDWNFKNGNLCLSPSAPKSYTEQKKVLPAKPNSTFFTFYISILCTLAPIYRHCTCTHHFIGAEMQFRYIK